MTHRKTISIIALLSAACFVAGCGKNQQPTPQQEASHSIAQAGQAIDRMKQERQDLKDNLETLRKENRRMLKKHFTLVRMRLNDYQKRLTALPADQEKTLHPIYQKLQQQMETTQSRGKQWLATSDETSGDLKKKFDDASDQLDVARADFEKKLANAETSDAPSS